MNYNVPVIELTEPERLWLEEVYERNKKGLSFSFRDIRGKLHARLPVNFRPVMMDPRLISGNGEEIRLLGVVALEKNDDICSKIDTLMEFIKHTLLKVPETRTVTIKEMADATRFQVEEISLLLRLICEFGSFYSGSSYEPESRLFRSIDVGGGDTIYYEYIQYPGIRKLVALKSYDAFTPKGEDFSIDERISMSAKVDSIIEDLQSLKAGQEVIWTDIRKDLEELKGLYNLDKKNWRQLLTGKLAEMVAGGIISETVSKKLIEIANPVVMKLLN